MIDWNIYSQQKIYTFYLLYDWKINVFFFFFKILKLILILIYFIRFYSIRFLIINKINNINIGFIITLIL